MITDKPFNAEKYHAERAEIRATIGENCEGWIYCIGIPPSSSPIGLSSSSTYYKAISCDWITQIYSNKSEFAPEII
jgi:hypothetical protein